jgi:hypothetical protein
MGSHMQPGGAVYYFVPWDQLEFLLAAAEPTFGKPIEMIVWADAKGTRGPVYQAHHEFVAMYVAGNVPPLHEGQLKKRGRHRANVWHYGVEGGTPGMKPIGLIKDILHDCTRRGEIILDPCARAGATLIAAEQTGRRARMIEKAPTWCDLILQKYQELTGLSAKLAGTSEPFPEVAARRVKESNEGGCRE